MEMPVLLDAMAEAVLRRTRGNGDWKGWAVDKRRQADHHARQKAQALDVPVGELVYSYDAEEYCIVVDRIVYNKDGISWLLQEVGNGQVEAVACDKGEQFTSREEAILAEAGEINESYEYFKQRFEAISDLKDELDNLKKR